LFTFRSETLRARIRFATFYSLAQILAMKQLSLGSLGIEAIAEQDQFSGSGHADHSRSALRPHDDREA
jgi:hypothetical protein